MARTVVNSITSKLHNKINHWFTGNQKVVRILSVSSKSTASTRGYRIIYQVRIKPEWIPREVLQQADFISCIVDSDDWSLQLDLFAKLDAK